MKHAVGQTDLPIMHWLYALYAKHM